MNIKLLARSVGSKYIIIRFGYFGIGSWKSKSGPNNYKEYRLGLFLVKIEDWR